MKKLLSAGLLLMLLASVFSGCGSGRAADDAEKANKTAALSGDPGQIILTPASSDVQAETPYAATPDHTGNVTTAVPAQTGCPSGIIPSGDGGTTAAPERTPEPAETPTPGPTAAPTPDYSYIIRAVSSVDFNGNGIDDYADILAGAKKDAANHPRYDGRYQEGGYPPDNIGVCSDVVWRAFREAGYSLRYMVDKDIRENPERYPEIYKKKEKRDSKIDFRRVRNLRIFFDKYAVVLTTDVNAIGEWQPGDIVIFNENSHIGIVSDKRNAKGQPYIIHNGGQAEREEDYLEGDHYVAAHYRFDASKIPAEMLIAWEGG